MQLLQRPHVAEQPYPLERKACELLVRFIVGWGVGRVGLGRVQGGGSMLRVWAVIMCRYRVVTSEFMSHQAATTIKGYAQYLGDGLVPEDARAHALSAAPMRVVGQPQHLHRLRIVQHVKGDGVGDEICERHHQLIVVGVEGGEEALLVVSSQLPPAFCVFGVWF